MRKALLVVLILSSALAWAQGGCTGQKPLNGVTTGGFLKALSNQAIRVCTDTANPCTLATLYTDSTLTTACNGSNGCTNPVTTDAAGNYQYCAAAGNYNEQATSTTGIFSQVNNTPVTVNGPGDVTKAGNNTFTGANTFTGTTTLPESSKEGGFSGLMAALNAGVSTSMNVFSDSTGVGTSRWPYLITQWLASRYPAYTVKFFLWNDTTQQFSAPTVFQTGALGARYLSLTGGGKSAQLPGPDIPNFTGDVDVRSLIQPTTWRPASDQAIMSRFGNSGLRSFRFDYNSLGQLEYQFTTDGTTLQGFFTSGAGVIASGTGQLCVRVTHQMNDGASHNLVKFYTAAPSAGACIDPAITWTQLGPTVTNTGAITGTLFNPASSQFWEIGGRGTTSDLFVGQVFSAHVMSGINGYPVGPQNIDAWQIVDGTTTFGGSPELDIVNGAMSGAGYSSASNGYLSLSTRIPAMALDYSPAVIIVSSSHNETYYTGPTLLSQLGSYITAIRSYLPTGRVVILTQNPRLSVAGGLREQALRQQQYLSWAKQNGYDKVDIYQAFATSSTPLTTLVNADGIHPSDAAGSPLWAQRIEQAMQGSQ